MCQWERVCPFWRTIHSYDLTFSILLRDLIPTNQLTRNDVLWVKPHMYCYWVATVFFLPPFIYNEHSSYEKES
jgi:hypothetical protein